MAAIALLVFPAATASADTTVVPGDHIRSVTVAGTSRLAWVQQDASGLWHLMLRAPDGTVSQPSIPPFSVAPPLSMGTTGAFSQRKPVVAYPRCLNGSSRRGCDIWAYNLTTGREGRVPGMSDPHISETAPSVSQGEWSFVRRDGAAPGVYRRDTFRRHTPVTRVSPIVARETSINEAGILFTYGHRGHAVVAVARGDARVRVRVLRRDLPRLAYSLALDRFDAAWLMNTSRGVAVYQTERFAGSHPVGHPRVFRADRLLPADTTSITVGLGWYAAGSGIVRVSPALFD